MFLFLYLFCSFLLTLCSLVWVTNGWLKMAGQTEHFFGFAGEVGLGTTSWLQCTITFTDKLSRFSAAKSLQIETQTTGKSKRKFYGIWPLSFPSPIRIRSTFLALNLSPHFFILLVWFFSYLSSLQKHLQNYTLWWDKKILVIKEKLIFRRWRMSTKMRKLGTWR